MHRIQKRETKNIWGNYSENLRPVAYFYLQQTFLFLGYRVGHRKPHQNQLLEIELQSTRLT